MPPLPRPRDGGGVRDNHDPSSPLLDPRNPLLITTIPSILRGGHGHGPEQQSDRRLPVRDDHDYLHDHLLAPRLNDDATTVPQGYGNTPSGPAAGVVAGIVLGSVAAFLLLLFLVYFCVNLGSNPFGPRDSGSVSGVTTSYRSRGEPSSVVSWHSRKHARAARGVPVAAAAAVTGQSRQRTDVPGLGHAEDGADDAEQEGGGGGEAGGQAVRVGVGVWVVARERASAATATPAAAKKDVLRQRHALVLLPLGVSSYFI